MRKVSTALAAASLLALGACGGGGDTGSANGADETNVATDNLGAVDPLGTDANALGTDTNALGTDANALGGDANLANGADANLTDTGNAASNATGNSQ